jgi:hypothetical protein
MLKSRRSELLKTGPNQASTVLGFRSNFKTWCSQYGVQLFVAGQHANAPSRLPRNWRRFILAPPCRRSDIVPAQIGAWKRLETTLPLRRRIVFDFRLGSKCTDGLKHHFRSTPDPGRQRTGLLGPVAATNGSLRCEVDQFNDRTCQNLSNRRAFSVFSLAN